jgi:hypothetical protein
MRFAIHQKYGTFAICIEYGWKIYRFFWYILAICIGGQDWKKI